MAEESFCNDIDMLCTEILTPPISSGSLSTSTTLSINSSNNNSSNNPNEFSLDCTYKNPTENAKHTENTKKPPPKLYIYTEDTTIQLDDKFPIVDFIVDLLDTLYGSLHSDSIVSSKETVFFTPVSPIVITFRDYLARIVKFLYNPDTMHLHDFIVPIIYIGRIMDKVPYFSIRVNNIHRLYLACLILFCKYQQDEPPSTKAWMSVGGITRENFEAIESSAFSLLSGDLYISHGELTWFIFDISNCLCACREAEFLAKYAEFIDAAICTEKSTKKKMSLPEFRKLVIPDKTNRNNEQKQPFLKVMCLPLVPCIVMYATKYFQNKPVDLEVFLPMFLGTFLPLVIAEMPKYFPQTMMEIGPFIETQQYLNFFEYVFEEDQVQLPEKYLRILLDAKLTIAEITGLFVKTSLDWSECLDKIRKYCKL